jgi:hypothetical protein
MKSDRRFSNGFHAYLGVASVTQPRVRVRRQAHRRSLLFVVAAVTGAAVSFGLSPLPTSVLPGLEPAGATISGYPTTPPARICGNAGVLDGPATAPAGSVRVNPGENLQDRTAAHVAGTVFWLAPGRHTLTDNIYDNVRPKDANVYVGAPGAVLDGRRINRFAFTADARNVIIRHLTITGFEAPTNQAVVNTDGGTGWMVERNLITGNRGAGVLLGSSNVVRGNCLKDNGQYGFTAYKPPVEGGSGITSITLDGNEITGNNTDNHEFNTDGTPTYCGCTGGGKFWDVKGASVTNNWVHRNKGVALWADTNNIDFLFEGNYINDNDNEGIWYEISYNATIRYNTLLRNAWVKGAQNQGAPAAGVYISESGGDPRAASAVSGAARLRVHDNVFDNNFSGVNIYENANRFCNSNGNTSKGYCTPFQAPTIIPTPHNFTYPSPINDTHPCFKDISMEPQRTNCRWFAKNIEINNNDFLFDPGVVPCVGNFCGVQALYATGADNMPWSPYKVSEIQNDVMFRNNNRFFNNRYSGPWRFAKGYGERIDWSTWRAAPFNHDQGSTYSGGPTTTTAPTRTTTSSTPTTIRTTTTTTVPATRNHLDAVTAGLEGGLGQWTNWYSASISRTTAQARSGNASMRVGVTAAYGWAVQLNNWPGFSASSGNKTIGLSGRAGSPAGQYVTMRVKWRDSSNAVIQTDTVTLALTRNWQEVAKPVTAPAGTAKVWVELVNTGAAGTYFFLDDLFIATR